MTTEGLNSEYEKVINFRTLNSIICKFYVRGQKCCFAPLGLIFGTVRNPITSSFGDFN